MRAIRKCIRELWERRKRTMVALGRDIAMFRPTIEAVVKGNLFGARARAATAAARSSFAHARGEGSSCGGARCNIAEGTGQKISKTP